MLAEDCWVRQWIPSALVAALNLRDGSTILMCLLICSDRDGSYPGLPCGRRTSDQGNGYHLAWWQLRTCRIGR